MDGGGLFVIKLGSDSDSESESVACIEQHAWVSGRSVGLSLQLLTRPDRYGGTIYASDLTNSFFCRFQLGLCSLVYTRPFDVSLQPADEPWMA